MRNKPEFVVFSGFNNRAVVAFCRAATQHKVPFHIVARCGSDPILQTTYASKIVFQRENDDLNKHLLQKIIAAIRKQGVGSEVFYVPSTEYLNRYVLAYRQECEEVGLRIDLVDRHLYEIFSDKESFYSLCLSAGLPVPKQHTDPCLESLCFRSMCKVPVTTSFFTVLTQGRLSPVRSGTSSSSMMADQL